jgi:hypothetical protein
VWHGGGVAGNATPTGSSEVVENDPNEEFQDQRSFFPVDFSIDYYYNIYIIKLLYYFNIIRYRFRTGSISAFVCVWMAECLSCNSGSRSIVVLGFGTGKGNRNWKCHS